MVEESIVAGRIRTAIVTMASIAERRSAIAGIGWYDGLIGMTVFDDSVGFEFIIDQSLSSRKASLVLPATPFIAAAFEMG